MSESAEDHYYATGYDAARDPYVYENGVLINHFGIKNTSQLNEIEAELSALSIKQLSEQPVPSIFSTDYYSLLHREIFSDVYPWAGELRKVDICKGSTIFLKNAEIQGSLEVLFSELSSHDFYRGYDAVRFSEHAGIFLNRLNFIHPFREGNGRTQRLLITQIAQ
jgi:cell filamentation protein